MTAADEKVIYELDEKPFGKAWSEWILEWWRWLLPISKTGHPTEDMVGKDFLKNQNQNSSNVLFLVGTRGGPAVRKICIPSGKAILIPVINFTTSFLEEPSLKTDSDLISTAKSDIDDIVNKEATIDDNKIADVGKYRVASSPFDITYPEDNLFGLPAGSTRCASDGYWLFVRPLSPGEHTIHAAGSCSSGRTSISITYHVIIKD